MCNSSCNFERAFSQSPRVPCCKLPPRSCFYPHVDLRNLGSSLPNFRCARFGCSPSCSACASLIFHIVHLVSPEHLILPATKKNCISTTSTILYTNPVATSSNMEDLPNTHKRGQYNKPHTLIHSPWSQAPVSGTVERQQSASENRRASGTKGCQGRTRRHLCR